MLNNFIYAETKDLFLEKLNAGEVLNEAIVFIEDTKEIWNHGQYFGGNNSVFIGNDTVEHWNNIQKVIDEGIVGGPCRFDVNTDVNGTPFGTYEGIYLCVTPYSGGSEGDYNVTMLGHMVDDEDKSDSIFQFNIWGKGTQCNLAANKLLNGTSIIIGNTRYTSRVAIESAQTILLNAQNSAATGCDINVYSHDNVNFWANKRATSTAADVTLGCGFNFNVGKYAYLFVGADKNSNSTYSLIPRTKHSSSVHNWDLGNSIYPFKYGYISSLYATSVYQTSDERLKNFESKIKIDFNKLASLKKHYFTWKDETNKDRQIGVSAQEIQELYPELVSQSGDKLTVAYDKLSVVALAAIDELHEENKQLRKELDELKDVVNVLKERIWGMRE